MSEQKNIVLILEDDEILRECLIAYFEDRGWEALSAGTAEEALEAVARWSPDCAVVDIRLPRMDGSAFLLDVSTTHPGMACVVCTGVPEYQIPKAVDALPQVSKKLFIKPVQNLTALEEELRLQIDRCESIGK